MSIELISEHGCFGGVQGFYRMPSAACGGPMRFAVYQPPQARERPRARADLPGRPDLQRRNRTMKAGAQRVAAELGLMLVMPDTSPRDTGIEGATGDWEFGEGAGFYLDATQAPWSRALPHGDATWCTNCAGGRGPLPGRRVRPASSAIRWAATAR